MKHKSCQHLFEAGKALVEKSGLANYCGPHFIACDSQAALSHYWQSEFHTTFGRYMAWVLFSVGAENLAKAACVCNNVVKASHKPTLEDYTKRKGHFRELCRKIELIGGERSTLQEGYVRLTKVRNRDAHSYRENVRRLDFPLVEQEFVPAFNVLLGAMRQGGHQLP